MPLATPLWNQSVGASLVVEADRGGVVSAEGQPVWPNEHQRPLSFAAEQSVPRRYPYRIARRPANKGSALIALVNHAARTSAINFDRSIGVADSAFWIIMPLAVASKIAMASIICRISRSTSADGLFSGSPFTARRVCGMSPGPSSSCRTT